MIIIDNYENIEKISGELKKIKGSKKIHRILINGVFHEGHNKFVEEMSKDCDILIAQFNEIFPYLTTALRAESYRYVYKKQESYSDIIDGAKKLEKFIDYMIINPLPPKDILDPMFDWINKDFPKIKQEFIRLNLPMTMALECAFSSFHPDPIQKLVDVERTSPKNLIQRGVHKKLFPEEYIGNDLHSEQDPNKNTIYKLYGPGDGQVYSRHANNVSFLRPRALALLHSGEKKFKPFEDIILYGNYIMDAKCSFIDLTSFERIYELNNNCMIVYGDLACYEVILIKDKNII